MPRAAEDPRQAFVASTIASLAGRAAGEALNKGEALQSTPVATFLDDPRWAMFVLGH
jgi:hypothetical protein